LNCAIHNQVPAVAYCRTCGKPMCEQCKRDVRGVFYCEDCLAKRVEGTLPPAPAAAPPATPVPPRTSGPNPVAATLLGFIPGVGAMYNGQVVKGLIHVMVFAGLIWAEDRSGGNPFFGILIAFFYFYMVWDAYATAKAMQEGRPLPDPFGLGTQLPAAETSLPPANPGPGTTIVRSGSAVPTAAIVLIALGVLFLLDNLGFFHWHWMGHLWPLILIAIGVWLFARRCGRPL
jgi:Domain of unknown function (DUF5668)/B-box zinc finger